MEINPEYVPPCGLYFGVCGILCATRDNNWKFKRRLVGVYRDRIPGSENLSVEDISCKGCLSAEPFIYCDRCAIKDCAIKRGYTGCHECKDFPCKLIEEFPMPVGKQVIFPIGAKWGQKSGLSTRKPGISAQSAATNFSVVLRGVMGVRVRST